LRLLSVSISLSLEESAVSRGKDIGLLIRKVVACVAVVAQKTFRKARSLRAFRQTSGPNIVEHVDQEGGPVSVLLIARRWTIFPVLCLSLLAVIGSDDAITLTPLVTVVPAGD
jgi:hypothetical protein